MADRSGRQPPAPVRGPRFAAVLLVAAALLLATAGAAAAAELASVNGRGKPLDRRTGLAAVSGNGRYVSFTVDLGLQPNDTLPEADVWLYDSRRGRAARISGRPRDHSLQFDSELNRNGRYVAFVSTSEQLVKERTDGPGKRAGGREDVFVYDRKRDRTELISHDAARRGNRRCLSPSISANGRFVAFVSNSDDLGTGDRGLRHSKRYQVFVYDRKRDRTELVSRAAGGAVADQSAWEPSISANGRYVAYYSKARNLAPPATEGHYDVFRYDRKAGATELVSVTAAGTAGNGASHDPSISADGGRIAFTSSATDLTAADGNGGIADVFVRDLGTGATELVSGPALGAADSSAGEATISGDGLRVGFSSAASNLVPGLTAATGQIYVRDLAAPGPVLISRAADGAAGDRRSEGPWLSTGGDSIAFATRATNLSREHGKRDHVLLARLGAG